MAEGYTEDSGGQFTEKKDPVREAEQAEVDEVKECLAFAIAFEEVQRRAETDELEFEGEDMWGHEARTNRAEHDDEVTGRKIPAKPTISVNLLDQNIQQVVSEARQARLSLTIKPKAGLSNSKTGDYLKGLVRGIQVESGSLEIRLWALERTAKVGRGGWRIAADYANDADFDLELREERILDYSTVYWDPYSVRADRSDADWCIITDWISEKERKRKWKTKPLIAPEGAFQTETDQWFAGDASKPDQRRCRIALMYKIVHTPTILGHHPEAGTAWIGTPPKGSKTPAMPEALAAHVLKGAPGTRQREVDVRTVRMITTDGSQVLERHPWHGRLIPVIETIGKEYFLKGKRRWKGVIANAMDLLRAINVLISSATEIAGTMPRVPYIMYEGQDEDFEDMWDNFPIKNYTRLYVKRLDVNGEPAPLPQRQQTELQVNGLLLLLRMMHEMYHAVTGSVAPQLRAVNPYDRSGKAIEALQRQGAAGTSNYLDNMATISMLYEGRCMLDAIPNYYDKVGRILNVVGEEHEDETAIMIKRPFIRDKDGQPVAVPCPMCAGKGMAPPSRWNPFAAAAECPGCHGSKYATRETMPQTYQDKEVEYVDFGEGEYKVVAAVDRSYQVKQDEALAGMTELAKASPELVPTYADLWVRAMGFSGSTEIADRIHGRMPEGDESMKDIPPALLGKFMQLKQQHDQAMQGLEEAHKMLESETIKKAGDKEIAMIRGAVQTKLEQVKLQGKMLQVKVETDADGRLEVLRGRLQSMQQESEQRHEAMLATLEQRHEIIMQLLKERGEKEVERHSVGLHAAAAHEAAEEANLHVAEGDARTDVLASRADARKDTLATRADARKDTSAAAADARKEAGAAAADSRAQDAAEKEAAREITPE